MRYLVFSDVQGDGNKLDDFLRASAVLRKDKFVCLGDIADTKDFGKTNQAVREVASTADIAVAGNHDRAFVEDAKLTQEEQHLAKKLSYENLEYLLDLPEIFAENGILFYHSSIQKRDLRLRTTADYERELLTIHKRHPSIWLALVGHMHKQVLYELPLTTEKREPLPIRNNYVAEKTIKLDKSNVTIANPGGIGLSFGETNGCALVDTDRSTIRFYEMNELKRLSARSQLVKLFEERWFPILQERRFDDFLQQSEKDAEGIEKHAELKRYGVLAHKLRQFRAESNEIERPTASKISKFMSKYTSSLAEAVEALTGVFGPEYNVKSPVQLYQTQFDKPVLNQFSGEWRIADLEELGPKGPF